MFQINIEETVKNSGGGDFSPVPDGWYPAQVESAELKETKSGGQRVSMRFDIIGDSYAGRVVWGNYNIVNSNPKAVEIAFKELAQLAKASGLTGVLNDAQQLVGRCVMLKLRTEEQQGYEPRNVIKGYRPTAGENSAPPAAKKQAASGPKPPWER